MRSVLLLLAACSASPATKPQPIQHVTADNTCEDIAWSCVRVKAGTDEAASCIEGNAAERDANERACTGDGRFALNGCLRDNVAGGCTLAREASCTTTWYATSRTAIEATCARQSALFVAP